LGGLLGIVLTLVDRDIFITPGETVVKVMKSNTIESVD